MRARISGVLAFTVLVVVESFSMRNLDFKLLVVTQIF